MIADTIQHHLEKVSDNPELVLANSPPHSLSRDLIPRLPAIGRDPEYFSQADFDMDGIQLKHNASPTQLNKVTGPRHRPSRSNTAAVHVTNPSLWARLCPIRTPAPFTPFPPVSPSLDSRSSFPVAILSQ